MKYMNLKNHNDKREGYTPAVNICIFAGREAVSSLRA